MYVSDQECDMRAQLGHGVDRSACYPALAVFYPWTGLRVTVIPRLQCSAMQDICGASLSEVYGLCLHVSSAKSMKKYTSET